MAVWNCSQGPSNPHPIYSASVPGIEKPYKFQRDVLILEGHENLPSTLDLQAAFCLEYLTELLKHLCVLQIFVASEDLLSFTGMKSEKIERV